MRGAEPHADTGGEDGGTIPAPAGMVPSSTSARTRTTGAPRARRVGDGPLPDHWMVGDRLANILDFQAGYNLSGHALADVRGEAGRAVAVRDAILAAAPSEEPAAIAAQQ
ncbi:hypothetical protein ACIQMV_39155 [Streptomyces sp. NPDC091412]|uniref:hypothetical protein n=1 Tax=Streptomyces sp. NPDC091412 TaxID=3366002 RepID=UPI00380724F9